MHVVDDALGPQLHRRRGLGVDAREEEPGAVVDLAELGFAGVNECPQIGDGHVATQERRLLKSAAVRVVLPGKKGGKQTVDLFGAREVCSKLVERGWVDAFFLSGGGSS